MSDHALSVPICFMCLGRTGHGVRERRSFIENNEHKLLRPSNNGYLLIAVL